ncbi:MAG: hypothetical protein ACAI25_18485, partial [Planctomycetota bacterium]
TRGARAHFDLGHTKEAEDWNLRGLARFPDHNNLIMMRFNHLAAQGRYEDALAYAEATIPSLNGEDRTKLVVNRCTLLLSQRRTEAAYAELSRIADRELSFEGLVLRAELHARLRRFDESDKDLAAARAAAQRSGKPQQAAQVERATERLRAFREEVERKKR